MGLGVCDHKKSDLCQLNGLRREITPPFPYEYGPTRNRYCPTTLDPLLITYVLAEWSGMSATRCASIWPANFLIILSVASPAHAVFSFFLYVFSPAPPRWQSTLASFSLLVVVSSHLFLFFFSSLLFFGSSRLFSLDEV